MTASLLRALSFAARKHRDQRRKGEEASPYVNHVIDVVTILACEGGVTDEDLLVAAILHDTVEDTATTFDELAAEFGPAVASLVREVTDDKSLPKATRKTLQIEHAPASSPLAKQLKIADKIANVRDICTSPPKDWSRERRTEYFEWAERVVGGCRGANAKLDAVFDNALRDARATLSGGMA